MAKDCTWPNAPDGNSMDKFKEKAATVVVDDWTMVRKGKDLLAKNVFTFPINGHQQVISHKHYH